MRAKAEKEEQGLEEILEIDKITETTRILMIVLTLMKILINKKREIDLHLLEAKKKKKESHKEEKEESI